MVMCCTPLVLKFYFTPNPLLITPTHTTRSKCIVPQYPPRQKLTEFGEFSHLMILFSCTDQEGKIFSRSFDCAAIFTLLRLYHRLSFWLDARKTCIFSLITSLVKWGLVSQYPQKTFLEHFWTILSSVWTLDIPEDLEVFNQSRELGLMSLVGETAFNASQMPNFTPGSLLNVLNKEPQEHNQLIR